METINKILILFFIVDVFFTYLNVIKFRKKFPDKDYCQMEMNPIAKFCWKRLGLFYGGIVSTIFALSVILLFVFNFSHDLKMILIGIYLFVIFAHLNNYSFLTKKVENKKRSSKIRNIIFILLIIMSIVDLGLTYNYVSTYKNWQPDRPYSDMEANPLLLFLWNNCGLFLGQILGALIIWTLIFIIVKEAHWLVILSLIGVFIFGIIINLIHISQLHNLIKLYPTGYI